LDSSFKNREGSILRLGIIYLLWIGNSLSLASSFEWEVQQGWNLLGSVLEEIPCENFHPGWVQIIWVFRSDDGGWKACSPEPEISRKLSEANSPSFSKILPGEGFFLRAARQGVLEIAGQLDDSQTLQTLPGSFASPWSLRANPFVRTSLADSQLPEDSLILVLRSGTWYSFPAREGFQSLQPTSLQFGEGFFYFSTNSTGVLTSSAQGSIQFPTIGVLASDETAFSVDPQNPGMRIPMTQAFSTQLAESARAFTDWIRGQGYHSVAIPPISTSGKIYIQQSSLDPSVSGPDLHDLRLLEGLRDRFQPYGVQLFADLSPLISISPISIRSISRVVLESYEFDGLFIEGGDSGLIADLNTIATNRGKTLLAQGENPLSTGSALVEVQMGDLSADGIMALQSSLSTRFTSGIRLFTHSQTKTSQRNLHLFHSLRNQVQEHWFSLNSKEYSDFLTNPGTSDQNWSRSQWKSLRHEPDTSCPIANISYISNKQLEQTLPDDLNQLFASLGHIRELLFSVGYQPRLTWTLPATPRELNILLFESLPSESEMDTILQTSSVTLLLFLPSMHAQLPLSSTWLDRLGLLESPQLKQQDSCPNSLTFNEKHPSIFHPIFLQHGECWVIPQQTLNSSAISILSSSTGSEDRVWLYQKDRLYFWASPLLPPTLRPFFASIFGVVSGNPDNHQILNSKISALLANNVSYSSDLQLDFRFFQGNLRSSWYPQQGNPYPKILYPISNESSLYQISADAGDLVLIHPNSPPAAIAGDDHALAGSTLARIPGLGTDLDQDILSYSWRQISGPPVSFSLENGKNLEFQAPEKQTLAQEIIFGLTVSDGQSASSEETVSVRVFANSPPVIQSGGDLGVAGKSLVTLDAVVDDSDDNALIYSWTQTSGPTVQLSQPNSLSTTFIAPSKSVQDQVLEFLLEVTDPVTASQQSKKVVIKKNIQPTVFVDEVPPVAGTRAQSMHASFFDPDGDAVSVSWTQVSGPLVILDNPTGLRPIFIAPDTEVELDLKFELIGFDGLSNSISVTIGVTVTPNPGKACLPGPVQICIE